MERIELTEDLDFVVQMNVKREDAQDLYDEVEGELAILFDRLLERQGGNELDVYKKLERVVSPNALSDHLSERYKQKVEVKETAIHHDHQNFKQTFVISIFVPNLWAINYGRSRTNDRLEEALEFLKEPKKEEEQLDTRKVLNGEPIEPKTGAIYFDHLRQTMKYWTGTHWEVVDVPKGASPRTGWTGCTLNVPPGARAK